MMECILNYKVLLRSLLFMCCFVASVPSRLRYHITARDISQGKLLKNRLMKKKKVSKTISPIKRLQLLKAKKKNFWVVKSKTSIKPFKKNEVKHTINSNQQIDCKYLSTIKPTFRFEDLNVRQKKLLKETLSQAQLNKVIAKHLELAKHSHGGMYFIVNSSGIYSASVQTHYNYKEDGIATYYNAGKVTCIGDAFSANNYTAAHASLPLPCVVEVVSLLDPRKKIIVKVNDRGPFVKNSNVIIDLTEKGAMVLGFKRLGKLDVRVRLLRKKTKMLRENGGAIDWDGRLPWNYVSRKRAYKRKRFVSKKHIRKMVKFVSRK